MQYSADVSGSWVQTNQEDFKAGTITGLDADSVPGQIALAPSISFFNDDFSNSSWTASHWTVHSGEWFVFSGTYGTQGLAGQYVNTYAGDQSWSNYTVEACVRYINGSYGPQIAARLDPSTGARYALWLYPSNEGPNVARLVKFTSWTGWSLLEETNVVTNTDWHYTAITVNGNNIKCYYDGELIFDATDSSFGSGCIGLETGVISSVSYDWVNVTSIDYVNSGILVSSAFDSGADDTEWDTISWSAYTPSETNIQFRTKTAATETELATTPWSDNYEINGSAIASLTARWIQYEATLATTNTTATPILYDVTISYSQTEPSPTPTPTSTPTPTPTPNDSIIYTLNINMNATVKELIYEESQVSLQTETTWIASDGTVYASYGSTLYKSSDGGESWQELRSFSAAHLQSLFVDSRDYVYFSPSADADANYRGLWVSTNQGQSWTRTLSLSSDCSIWAIDEDANGNVFAGVYTGGYTVGNARIYKSSDNGTTWDSVYHNSTGRHIHDIAVDKSNNYIYAAVGDDYLSWTSYMIRSIDGGATWSQILSGIPQIVAVEAIPGARLLGTDNPISDNGRIFKTTDDADYSQVLSTGVDCYGFWFRTNPLNGRIYTSFVSGEHSPYYSWIFTSDNNGATWLTYHTYTVSTAYYGSPSASNFVNGTMYYSLILDNGTQNCYKIYPTYTSSANNYLQRTDQTPSDISTSAQYSKNADSADNSWPLLVGSVAAQALLPLYLHIAKGKWRSKRFGYRFPGSNSKSNCLHLEVNNS